MAGKKRGKDRNTKIWTSWEWKKLSDDIKSIFHTFWRAIIWWKNKNLMKIADTSFTTTKKYFILSSKIKKAIK